MAEDLAVTSAVVIPGAELTWTAVRSGGPGGQNVNKVATKVELRFAPLESRALTESVRSRLLALAAARLDAQQRIVVLCDTTRSQRQNLALARERLAELVRAALVVPKRRRKTRPSAGAKKRRLEDKRHTGEKKRARRGGASE